MDNREDNIKKITICVIATLLIAGNLFPMIPVVAASAEPEQSVEAEVQPIQIMAKYQFLNSADNT